MVKPENFDTQRQFILHIVKGDEAAAACCETLFAISQVLDDIVDAPTTVPARSVGAMVMSALIGVQCNAFFAANFSALAPVIQASYYDWQAATMLERDGTADSIRVAYTLRDSLTRQILVACAQITGGVDWAHAMNRLITTAVHDEPFETYLQEHTNG